MVKSPKPARRNKFPHSEVHYSLSHMFIFGPVMMLLRAFVTFVLPGAIALAFLSTAAHACDRGAVALFSCDAAKSRKFIELCAPSPLDARSGYLVYRYGSLDKDGAEKAVELVYPAETAGSLRRF